MVDSLINSAAFPWFVGASIGAIAVFLIVGFLRKSAINIGKLRPQILIVLFALSLIALAGLFLEELNVTSLSVGGMIALATRIIEQDSKPRSD